LTDVGKENRMLRDKVEQYRRWYAYERDAHAKVIASLDSVPPERRSTPEFRRAVALLAHITAGRWIWLGRLGVVPAAQASMFPADMDFPQVVDQLKAVEASWAEYLEHLCDEDLARSFKYKSLDAGWFQNRVEDIFTQLFGHSSYHRGQIAMLVRTSGGEPAITDLIFWCREPTAPSGTEA
jgi:uncharacterized damage-inducible protein DinB